MGDTTLDELLEAARTKIFHRDLIVRKEALVKLWDAWERLKTIEPGKDKKARASAILDKASFERPLRARLEEEAMKLTEIGNNFMIRHAETTKVPVPRARTSTTCSTHVRNGLPPCSNRAGARRVCMPRGASESLDRTDECAAIEWIMLPHTLAVQRGLIPIRNGPVRFAVGDPKGLTSNAWRVWTTRGRDVYVACRDSFKEMKVSLHASGRWRMGFTSEAIAKRPDLIRGQENRAWAVWDRPPESPPKVVTAFRLFFAPAELAVRPEQREPKEWKDVVFIEAAPPGKLTVVTLFVTTGDLSLAHETEPSFRLASLDIGNGRFAQLVAHGEVEGHIPEVIERCVERAIAEMNTADVSVPEDAFSYFFGHAEDGCRFIVGARVQR